MSQDVIKVVIVTDSTDERIAVKNRIQQDPIVVVGYADYISNTMVKIKGWSPHAIILAHADQPMKRFDLARALSLEMRGCTVMILDNVVDMDLITKAMKSGVRLVYPITASKDELKVALQEGVAFDQKRFGNTDRKLANCRVMSFFSGKGGVGKTTVAVNTALELVNIGKKVLLIDGDLNGFGDCHMHLDIDPKGTIAELVQERSNLAADDIRRFLMTHVSGLEVLCAPKRPEYAEYVNNTHMDSIISTMRPYYDYIVIDLPDSLNDITLTAADNSDVVFLVCGQEIASLKNAKIAMGVLESLNLKEKIRLVVNKAADGSMIKVKDFEQLLGLKAQSVIPDDTKNMLMCLNKGTPVVMMGKTAVGEALKTFASRIARAEI